MLVSTKWLSKYVPIDRTTTELVELLINLGVEVETATEYGADFSGVVTARIEEVHPHPNADQLKLCDVTDGKNMYSVVCGAPNCRRGLVTALALAGAELPAGQVHNTSIRGVKSSGMLVSKRELGLSEDHSGIMELPDDLPLGRELAEACDLLDTVLDLSITPNRPDQLSMIGMAREISAGLNKPLEKPEVPLEPVGGAVDSLASVRIDDPDLCPRYTGILLKGITIGPSPLWMQSLLESVGVRSINNVVDITNFVQLECGQPLHAFDFDFLADRRIVVRRSVPDEKIVTLDEQERTLPKDSLLICDGEKPVALAGIMGGLNSLVTGKTRDVLIESAYFNPTNIRKTSKALGLSSESSYRFERGVDIDGVVYGLHRCVRLMEQYCGGRIVNGYIDNYPVRHKPQVVSLRPERANQLLGTEIDTAHMEQLLHSIELPVQSKDGTLQVQVPPFRIDLEREVDLIEEVARLYGFENIPATLPGVRGSEKAELDERKVEQATREILVALGMHETLNFAFSTSDRLDWFKEKPGKYVKVTNPLSEEYGYLRDTLLVGLCQNLINNLNRQAKQVALFEIRRVYRPSPILGELPAEPLHCSGVFAGRREPEGWAQSDAPFDFFDAKGICEVLLESLGVERDISWHKSSAPFLDPLEAAEVHYKKKVLGSLGRLGRNTAKKIGIGIEPYVFEFDLSLIQKDVLPTLEYKTPSRFPVTTRDLSIVVNKGIEAEQIRQNLLRIAPDLIREVICFDYYQGDKIQKNEKSLAFSIRMQNDTSEVPETEAEQIVRKAVAILISRFGAKLRE